MRHDQRVPRKPAPHNRFWSSQICRPPVSLGTTLEAVKKGAKSFTIEKATTNIESWEDYLSKHDHEGVKKVVTDLGKLKKLLHAKELDGEAIKTLVQKLRQGHPLPDRR